MTAPSSLQTAFYPGTVVHSRLRPKRHRMRYGVVSALIDLDELPTLDREVRFFGHNRFAPVSFHDADHGPGDGTPLRAWVAGELRRAGIPGELGAVRVLCYPRLWGYVFNPLSVFFCHKPDGTLAALIYEVSNTFSERHAYVLAAGDVGTRGDGGIRQACAKTFYVSPFMAVEGHYRFRVRPPGESVTVAIQYGDGDGTLLTAAFAGSRRPFANATVRRLALRQPLMTIKVIVGIHWEALRLWFKGVPLQPRPRLGDETTAHRHASSASPTKV